jgi:predicted O-linked N-acetylglucosamine transferase (SPINDLY family)
MPGHIDAGDALRKAIAHHQQGSLDEAAALYGEVLQSMPNNPDALHYLGVVHHQKGQSAEAAEMIRRAIEVNGANPSYHANLGVALQRLGRADEAADCYRKAIDLDPTHADANGNLGHLLKDRGERDEAIQRYEAAIRYQPRVRAVHKHLGALYLDSGRTEDAAKLLGDYVAVAPQDPEALANYGYTFEALSKMEEAEAYYRRAHELAPQSPEIASNLGNALSKLGRHGEAVEILAKAAALAPEVAGIMCNQALAFTAARDYAAAIPLFQRLIALDPDRASYHHDLGTCFANLSRTEEAVQCFGRAMELEPEVGSHACNMGMALLALNRFDDGAAMLRRAVDLDSSDAVALGNLCSALKLSNRLDEANLFSHLAILHRGWEPRMSPAAASCFRATCDFEGLEETGDQIDICDKHVDAENLIGAFLDLRPLTETMAADLRLTALHRKWGDAMMARAADSPLQPLASPKLGDKIRIGFLSSDLRSHAVAKFLMPIFDGLDRERFEIYCYAQVEVPGDETQAELRAKSDAFRIVARLLDRDLAALIREDGVDILFDLNGATHNSRLAALAWRPAPVQVSWLGYGGTTGLKTVDYALVDRFVRPTKPQLWTEQFHVMKGPWVCFSGYPEEPIDSTPPAVRNGVVTFGTMNASYKYTPGCIALWARVMNQVPDSRFLFVRPHFDSIVIQTNLVKAFAKHGIGAERFFFIANANGSFIHLPHYNEIDVALDSYPAAGGTTTTDTLWMGVPVIGRHGPNMHSRLHHALVSHCGHPEFSCTTEEEYVSKAVALATDPAALAHLRATLRDELKASPLYDAAGFAADFQERMVELVQRHKLR